MKTPHLPAYRLPETRHQFALINIVTNRLSGQGNRGDIIAAQEAGYLSLDDFMADSMSEPMSAEAFVRFLDALRIDVLIDTHKDSIPFQLHIAKTLSNAIEEGVTWAFRISDEVRDGPQTAKSSLGYYKVRPRDAVEWMMSRPRHRSSVPRRLIDYLGGGSATKVIEGALTPPLLLAPDVSRPRGRDPEKRTRVKREMRAMDQVELSGLKGKEMQNRFKAGRTMCSDARREVLSERR